MHRCAAVYLRLFSAAIGLLLGATPLTALDSACAASGYCSLGATRTYTGDIRTGAALRALVKAVSFKSELVFTSAHDRTNDGRMEDALLQLYGDWTALGMSHMFVLALDSATCSTVQRAEPRLSCVWDTVPWLKGSMPPVEQLWNMRWRLMGRLARLGVNAMSLDADMMVLQDPYLYLKQPPLSTMTIICQDEIGLPYCNGGFMYVQNAAPDGPVTWALRFVAEIALRFMEDGGRFMASLGRSTWPMLCMCFDQSYLHDVFGSARVGRLLLPSVPIACIPGDTANTMLQAKRNQSQNAQRLVDTSLWSIRFQAVLPSSLASLPHQLHPRQLSGRSTFLHVPNLALGWHDELGGRLLPDPGNWTETLHAQLRDDCPACPWWDDQRPVLPSQHNASGVGQPPDVFHDDRGAKHKETMGVPPSTFVQSMSMVRHGLVAGPSIPRPGQVMLHVHFWHMGRTNAYHKTSPRKLLGRYNYTLGKAMLRRSNDSVYTSARPVRRLLALSPHLDLGYTRNWTEHAHVLLGLLQVALLTKRTAVLPNLPCHTPWLHPPETHAEDRTSGSTWCEPPVMTGFNRLSWPLPYAIPVDADGWLLGAPAPDPRNSNASHAAFVPQPDGVPRVAMALHLHWDARCTEGLGSIFMPEMQHWLASEEGKGAQVAATSDNTAMLLCDSAVELRPWPQRNSSQLTSAAGSSLSHHTYSRGVLTPQSAAGWSLADVMAGLPVGQVLKEMRRFQDQPLVYLGHPVAVLAPSRGTSHTAALTSLLAAANGRIKASECRAVMADPRTWGRDWGFEISHVVNATIGVPCMLRHRRLSLRQGAQLAAPHTTRRHLLR